MSSFTNLLIHTCDIQEKALVQDGIEKVEDWSDVATDVACRKDRAPVHINDQGVRINTNEDLFFFNSDVVIERGNRIVHNAKNYDVIEVSELNDSIGVHHLEVIAKIIDNH